jgi:hypothetical protein
VVLQQDLTAETDALHPAPAGTTTIRLPDAWRGRDVQASHVTPEMDADAPPIPLTGEAAVVDRQTGTLRLRTLASKRSFWSLAAHARRSAARAGRRWC